MLESFEPIVSNGICAGSCGALLTRVPVCFPLPSQKKQKADAGSASGVAKAVASPTPRARSARHDSKGVWFKWENDMFAPMKGKYNLVRMTRLCRCCVHIMHVERVCLLCVLSCRHRSLERRSSPGTCRPTWTRRVTFSLTRRPRSRRSPGPDHEHVSWSLLCVVVRASPLR